MPDDTCFKECPFYKRRETCHNHVVTAWKDDKGNVKLVHDCAPRRALQMQVAQETQTLALRQEVAQAQHSVAQLAKSLEVFITSFRQIKQIEE
jgi:hypothetical protein